MRAKFRAVNEFLKKPLQIHQTNPDMNKIILVRQKSRWIFLLPGHL